MRISDWSSDVCSSDLLAARRFLLDQAQRRQARRRCGADEPGALAMWAGAGRCLEHAGAQSLAAHLHQPKAGDAADLDARAVVLQRLLHLAPDLVAVRTVIPLAEVDPSPPRPVP